MDGIVRPARAPRGIEVSAAAAHNPDPTGASRCRAPQTQGVWATRVEVSSFSFQSALPMMLAWDLRRSSRVVPGEPISLTIQEHPMAAFEIYKDKSGQFRWRLKANNGKIIADSGEGYVA